MENKYNIDKITIYKNAHTICPLGDDWYTTQCKIEMIPLKEIPDYRDIDNYFEKEIDGKIMTVEKVVSTALKHIVNEYQPKECVITSIVEDSNHSKVEIKKKYTQSKVEVVKE